MRLGSKDFGIRFALIFSFVILVGSSTIVNFVNPVLSRTDSSSSSSSSSSSPLPTISSIPTAPSTIGQDGKEGDFTTQALSSLTARPTNNIVNTNSFYDIVFVTGTSGAIKRIQVTFPAGTTVPTGASFNEAEGIGPGTVSKSGQTLTYTVTNAVNVPAGTKIRLEFANINNPLNPSANYKVTVTTRNSANTPIDGPTQSNAYTMKQIGVNVIADGAVTAPKILPDTLLLNVIQRPGLIIPVPAGIIATATASCSFDEQLVGGANTLGANAPFDVRYFDEIENPTNTWQVRVGNAGAAPCQYKH